MSWDNYKKTWCIDHIVPLRYFDPTNEKDMKLCWNYNNLKPTFISDNHAKGYCIEVTKKILDGKYKNAVVVQFLNKIKGVENMFQSYYKTAI